MVDSKLYSKVLVADSGSTATQWNCGVAGKYSTIGLNPLFATDDEVWHALHEVAQWAGGGVSRVYFYGAGCGTPQVCNEMRHKLQAVFHCDEVEVESDMLGACRAALGDSEGIAAILGTGSNACYYDGRTIRCKTMASGFLLGDEGSGNHIGRMLAKAFLQHRMPDMLAKKFESEYLPCYAAFMDSVYRSEMPNRYLATMVRFAIDNAGDKFIIDLLSGCFDSFFEQQVKTLPLQSERVCFVGGVAYQFQNLVSDAARRAGHTAARFVKEPIDALAAYHSEGV